MSIQFSWLKTLLWCILIKVFLLLVIHLCHQSPDLGVQFFPSHLWFLERKNEDGESGGVSSGVLFHGSRQVSMVVFSCLSIWVFHRAWCSSFKVSFRVRNSNVRNSFLTKTKMILNPIMVLMPGQNSQEPSINTTMQHSWLKNIPRHNSWSAHPPFPLSPNISANFPSSSSKFCPFQCHAAAKK